VAPTQAGTYDASVAFYTGLSPFYIKVMPITDQWGTEFYVYCGIAANGEWGISGAQADDFVIASFGRDGVVGAFQFDDTDPEGGLFVVSAMTHFNYDLVQWNGSWIRGRRTSSAGGT
jgi:hypothetical protein